MALLEVVVCFQDARFEQVEAGGRVAAVVEGAVCGEGAADEEGREAAPEGFGLGGEGGEGLEDELQGLVVVLPFRGRRGVFEGVGCYLVQMVAAGRAVYAFLGEGLFAFRYLWEKYQQGNLGCEGEI